MNGAVIRAMAMALFCIPSSCKPVKVETQPPSGLVQRQATSTDDNSPADDGSGSGPVDSGSTGGGATPPGSLSFNLGDFIGLGRADVGSNGAGLLSAISNQLVAIRANGESVAVPPGTLSFAGGASLALVDDDPVIDVVCLVPVTAGTLIVARTKGTNAPYFASGTSQLGIIANDNTVHHIPSAGAPSPETIQIETTKCDTAVQQSSDGGLFVLGLNGQSVWRINTTTWTASVVLSASAGESISEFLATDQGNIFYSSSSGGNTLTKWFKVASSTTVDMGYPNNRISSPMSLPGGQGFTFLSSGKAGGVVLSVIDGTALRSFIEPIYPTGNSTSWSGPVDLRIGNWIFTRNTALNPMNSKMASNPFWRSEGRFQGLVDLDNQIYFDGSNLVKVTYESGALRVRHHKSILQDATLTLKIQAVFGPAQGFTDKWVGFATNESFITGSSPNLFWVEIDPASGILDSTRIFKLQAPNMPPYWSNPNVIPDFTPYQLTKTDNTKKLIGFGGTWGASIVDLSFDESDTANKKVNLSAAKGGVYSYYHPRAVIHGPRLYMTASYYDGTPNAGFYDKVFYYDADTDTVTTNDAGQGISTVDLLPRMNTTDNKCNGSLVYGLFQIPGQPGPSMMYCGSDYLVRIATFTDFTFTSIAYDRPTTVETPGNPANPDTSDTYGDFASGTVNNIDWMQAYPLDATTLAIGLGRRAEVRLLNPVVQAPVPISPTNTETTQSYGVVAYKDLLTEGRIEFWKLFVASGGDPVYYAPDASTLARWDDNTLFAAGTKTDNTRVAWLINLDTAVATEIVALRGFNVQSAIRIDATSFMVSGTEAGAATQAVNVTLDNSGAETARGNATTLIKEVVEINRGAG